VFWYKYLTEFHFPYVEFNAQLVTRITFLNKSWMAILSCKQEAELTITVLNETREVKGTETRVIEERETFGGELVEISRNFFAIIE
jgi:hypothetical protein